MEIDVSKCKFKDNFYGTCKATKDGDGECEVPCFDYKNCYYKQLQQLKEDYEELLNRHNESFDNFKQLKAENEAYKNSIVANLDLKTTRSLARLLEENEELKNQIKSEINATQK